MGREHSRWTGWRGNRARADYAAAVLAAAFLWALPAWGQVELNVVGTWGGAVNAVFVDEAVNPDIAYVAAGRRLVILNVADPANILELGSIDLGNLVMDLKVRAGYAYVCTFFRPNHFCVVSVSDPTDPQLVWHHDDPFYQPREVELYNNIAYVRAGSDLDAFDISNPESPRGRGRVLHSDANTIKIVGDLMYVGWDSFRPAFRVYDLSVNPLNPTLLAELPLPSPFWGPLLDIAIEGDLAVVIGDPSAHSPLGVLDISDPRAPALMGTFTSFVWPRRVDLAGGFAFVADGMGGTDPSIWLQTKGLAILDVATNPTNPAPVGNFKTHGTVSGVKVVGERAYVMDEGEGLIILGIADPANPVRLGSWHSPADLRQMDKVDDLLYITDRWNGVTILNLSDPTSPALVGVYQTPLHGMGDHWGIEVRNDLAHLSAGWAGVEVVSVSDPGNPQFEGAFRLPAGVRTIALGLAENGEIAHVGVSTSGTGVFTNFDVTDPRTIRQVGSVAAGGKNWTYDVAGNAIVYAATNSAISSVDSSIPSSPVVLGSLSGFFGDLVHDGADLLYVSNYRSLNFGGGLYVVDVSDTRDPVTLGHFASARGGAVAEDNGLVYFLTTWNGVRSLLVLDVSDPAAPVLLDYAPAPGAKNGVLVDGRYAYVTGGNGENADFGLVIIEISGLSAPGDLNCDGALNGADIDPFFLALGDPVAYRTAFPNCDIMNADMNADGAVNGADIDPFFECLGGGVCP